MPIQPQNPQLQSLYASLFNYNNWSPGVIDLDRGWARPYKLFDAINNSTSFGIDDYQGGKLQVVTMPRAEVVQQVQAVAQAGADLTVTWVDPTYNSFRIGQLVRDSNGYQGQVSAASPGQVTISPATFPAALVAATHFVALTHVTALGYAAGNSFSTGTTSLYKTEAVRYNWAAVTRESQTMARTDKFYTWKRNDVAYYYTLAEEQMLRRFVKDRMKRYIFSEPGQFNGVDGTTNLTQGLRAAIRDQGGLFVSQPSNFTQAQFETWLDFVSSKTPGMYQDYLLWCGRNAWETITNFYTNNITYTVSTKLAQGQAIDFDIKEVTLKGITMKIMVGDIFDDTIMFPALSSIAGINGTRMSNTLCILNLSPVPDANDGSFIPSCRKFHWSNAPGTAGGAIYKVIPGMTGPGSGNDTGPTLWNNYQLTSTSVDGCSFEVLDHSGIDFTADGCVWFELAS